MAEQKLNIEHQEDGLPSATLAQNTNVIRRFKVRLRPNDEYSKVGAVWVFDKSFKTGKRWTVIYSRCLAGICFVVWRLNGV